MKMPLTEQERSALRGPGGRVEIALAVTDLPGGEQCLVLRKRRSSAVDVLRVWNLPIGPVDHRELEVVLATFTAAVISYLEQTHGIQGA